jgi:hypothetical protein
MNVHMPPSIQAPLPASERTWPGRLVTLATVIVVVAVAAATFVLSYSGVHAVALQSGISASLAKYYPGVFDAVLVIACAAAPLRDARLWTRLYTWLVIFVVIGLLAAMDAVHAMGVTLPRKQMAGTVAVLPWVLLLLAFTLWLVILRHFRVQQSRQLTPVPAALLGPPSALELPAAPQSPELPEITDSARGDGQAPQGAPAPAKARRGAGRPARPALLPGTSAPPATAESLQPAGRPESGGAPAPDSEAAAVPEPAASDYWESSDPAAMPDPLSDAVPGEATSGETDQGPEPDGPGQSGETDGVPEVGGVPYATGPRLRRVRSLPVPPAEDEDDEEGTEDAEDE